MRTMYIRTTCPRDCYDGCGIKVEVTSANHLRVRGDEQHPVSRGTLCAKCGVAYNGVFQDESARLKTPLRRTGPNGSGKFEPVPWEEALDEIALRFHDIIQEFGADAILTGSYTGTLSLLAFFFPDRLTNYLGTTCLDYGTVCNAAGLAAWELLFGTAVRGFDPRTAADAGCILVWGANPSHTAPHADRPPLLHPRRWGHALPAPETDRRTPRSVRTRPRRRRASDRPARDPGGSPPSRRPGGAAPRPRG